MIYVYNLVLLPLVLLLLPFALLRALFTPRLRQGLSERFMPLMRMPHDTVWIHAASVGEAEAAAPLIAALLERGCDALATTLTVTGRERLRARFPGLHVRLAPLDLPGLIQLSLRRARVATLVLIETEIWPNLIHATHARGARAFLVSARLSDASFPRYRRLRWLFAPFLRKLDRVGARSELDRERLIAIGAPDGRTHVVGDLKLDRPDAPAPSAALRAALGQGPLFVGGSTHAGEDEALLAAWRELRVGDAPQLRLVLVPRHPERVPEVLKTARRHHANAALRSAGAAEADVVVVDTVGELGAIYALAELVFVGGTLAPIGGHNLVEPVRAGKVVMHGPHTENQRTGEALLRPLGALVRVSNARELTETARRLWADDTRNQAALRAQVALETHRGASQRSLELILDSETSHA